MKIRFSIKRQIQLSSEVLEEKIYRYLEKNFYRIVDKGPGFVIFIDDEYSDRKQYRSDYHTRIGEGKFIFLSAEQGTNVKLIYLTPILYPVFLILVSAAFGIYVKSVMPAIFSFAFFIPVILKRYYLNEHVFNEILEC